MEGINYEKNFIYYSINDFWCNDDIVDSSMCV